MKMDFSYADVSIRAVFDASYDAGGSKRRKFSYFLKDAIEQNANAIVTAGAANSNHAKVAALACAEQGWECTIVVHDNEDYSKGNLLLMKMSGARLVFTTLEQVGPVMDAEMQRFRTEGKHPYYVYGGGHGLPGYLAYYDAAHEFVQANRDFQPDFIVHASGTGGTQAGLIVGFNQLLPHSQVLGVSVARQRARGEQVLRESCDSLSQYLGFEVVGDDKIEFADDWIGDGYGSTSPELFATIKYFARKHGLITDPTYTGKALHGLKQMIDNGRIAPGSKVLFWHTGGLINLFEHTQELIK
ncbi:hypothetical protein CWE13_05020 [Aliidiomarina shirensis]|uniref:Tryptophan synthase beta chain-like PALP domain-containing protein n=2 Tax=Aliidiomarina shirensis TaxID=1048642 RepID=A0A432WUA5_9GAMM|nr:hypothetical protein CWE13_05020 [Aliidiomarina shirensis]